MKLGEMANSVRGEWVELDRKAARLRSACLPRLYTATGMAATESKLHCDDYMAVSLDETLLIFSHLLESRF